jgi:hypothetical protein
MHEAATRDELALSVVADVSPWLLMLPVRFELPSAIRNKVRPQRSPSLACCKQTLNAVPLTCPIGRQTQSPQM